MTVTNHFSRLTEAEQERLVILMEECAEVIQAGAKVLRHGYESTNPKKNDQETNKWALEREIGDLLHAIDRLTVAHDLNRAAINESRQSKAKLIEPYLHHQGALDDDRITLAGPIGRLPE